MSIPNVIHTHKKTFDSGEILKREINSSAYPSKVYIGFRVGFHLIFYNWPKFFEFLT